MRTTNGGPKWTGLIRLVPEKLPEPLRWRQSRRIFVNSMSDLFHEAVPFDFIAAVFGVMAACPQHTFQILTKRPAVARSWFRWMATHDGGARLHACWEALRHEALRHPDGDSGPLHVKHAADPDGPWPLPNVHLGVSVEDQATADERTVLLLDTPAAVRFVSYEPALGPVDFAEYIGTECRHDESYMEPDTGATICRRCDETELLDWLIVGGESGPGARPCDVEWIRSVIRQCREAGVPVFVKQLGAMAIAGRMPHSDDVFLRLRDRKGADPTEWSEDLRVQEFPA